ncbi:hypothetical protein AB3R30_18860 [Leptolyngbyaceae cyanobacterium UHCC 1019]
MDTKSLSPVPWDVMQDPKGKWGDEDMAALLAEYLANVRDRIEHFQIDLNKTGGTTHE